MATVELICPEFQRQDAVIAKMKTEYADMSVERDGFEAVRAARIEVKNVRCKVENLRKELKADVLQRGKLIDGEAKRLTSMIEPIEAALEREEKAEVERKAAIARKAQEDAERKIQARVDAVVALCGSPPNLAMIRAMDDEAFSLYLAKIQHESELAAEAKRIEEAERLKREEAERIERERIEAEKAAELARQAEEIRLREAELAEARKAEEERLRIENAKLEQAREEMRLQQEEERKAEEERRRAEQERINAERAELQRQHEERLKAEAEARRIEEDRIAAERAEIRRQQEELAEQQRIAAEEKRKADEAKRLEAERIEAEHREAERIEKLNAAKPDLEKAQVYAGVMVQHARDEIIKLGRPAWSDEVLGTVEVWLESVPAIVARILGVPVDNP